MFSLGRTQYGSLVYSMPDDDTRLCLKKFKSKYWGNVDAETWASNDAATFEGTGEIKALYILEDGKEVHVTRTADSRYTLVGSSEDTQQFMEQLSNRPRRRSPFELFA
ncbi:hypothetical protein EDO6_06482 [Paenibacillus xylanexedens]|nr:hypothetical protein EDO6_06482 [Paenibacillus xylanexedens]